MDIDPSRFTLSGECSADLAARLASDLVRGFRRAVRELPPAYFYDARGAALYDAITHTTEYYPTAVETDLLRAHAGGIARATRAVDLVEIGSGVPAKASLLVGALEMLGARVRYVPVDLCETAIAATARALLARHAALTVHGVVTDFSRSLSLPPRAGPRLVVFLGSTIGNFAGDAAVTLLARIRRRLGPGDAFLLGTDLRPGRIKTRERIELAYNDPPGLTEQFNKNVLLVANRLLGADFDPDDWRHRAPYVARRHRIEMHLVARRALTVTVPACGRRYRFVSGQIIRTEISCKYDRPAVERMLRRAGFTLESWMTDRDGFFALSLCRPRR